MEGYISLDCACYTPELIKQMIDILEEQYDLPVKEWKAAAEKILVTNVGKDPPCYCFLYL